MERVSVYTDGGAEPNPGAGGWGAVLVHPASGEVRELSGSEGETTNNRMEMTAAIRSLEALKSPCEVDLYTDSTYLRRGITEWLPRWKAAGWRRRDGEPVKNDDLWRELEAAAGRHHVRWHWVKGHAGHPENERAHELASAGIRTLRGTTEPREAPPLADGEIGILFKQRCAGGRGSWLALVVAGDDERAVEGRASGVTPNQLELRAAAALLGRLPAGAAVRFVGGSDYLRRGASEWLAGWKSRGFRTREGGEVKNASLWRALDVELASRRVRFIAPAADEAKELDALGKRLRKVG